MPKPRTSFFKRLLGLRLLLVANMVVLVLLSLSFGREFVRNFEIQKEIERLQTQEEELAARNLQITKLNTAFQTESFIEREARLKLGMKKPGENVVVIQQPAVGGEPSDEEEEKDPLNLLAEEEDPYRNLANSTKWWYYFFDRNRYKEMLSYE